MKEKIWPNNLFSLLKQLKGGRENLKFLSHSPHNKDWCGGRINAPLHSNTLRSTLIHRELQIIYHSLLVWETDDYSFIANILEILIAWFGYRNIPMFLTKLQTAGLKCMGLWPKRIGCGEIFGGSSKRIGVREQQSPWFTTRPLGASRWLADSKAWPTLIGLVCSRTECYSSGSGWFRILTGR